MPVLCRYLLSLLQTSRSGPSALSDEVRSTRSRSAIPPLRRRPIPLSPRALLGHGVTNLPIRGLALLLSAAPLICNAATFKVNVTQDAPDAKPGDGVCSYNSALNPQQFAVCTLRAAVMEANATPKNQPAIVQLEGGKEYKLSLQSLDGLKINRSMTIGIPDGETIPATIDANSLYGAITIFSTSANTRLYGLEIIGGMKTFGAAVYNFADDVTLERLNVHSNFSEDQDFFGCAIRGDGDMLILESRIHHNGSENAPMSGVCSLDNGLTTIVRSTVDHNSRYGFGSENGSLLLHSSTVTGNGFAGISTVNANATIVNSTIGKNLRLESYDSGEINFKATNALYKLDIRSSIINVADEGVSCKVVSAFSGIPVVVTKWNALNRDSCKSTSQDEGSIFNAELNLSELADWGGATPTHMLLYGSEAIDAAPVEACTELGSDQRGLFRPIDLGVSDETPCDIGAVEISQLPSPPLPTGVFSDNFESDEGKQR